ncbi:PDR/VanB family oxidoreductase [Klebsiella sp. I138]|uniref:PDR/VanB family oxidoreductase n=1 Tax=Klebsiella sp. I138 TaxID=2755385 RepID=UPI003DA7DC0E
MAETLTVRVAEREIQGADVAVLTLTSLDGSPLPPFSAGAHIDLYLGEGIVRQYSLCSSPHHPELYRLGILRDRASRGGSLAAHELQVGATVVISPPRNLFALEMNASYSLLIGGGIGITPMLAMADALFRAGKSFTIHYCGRHRDGMAFLHELADCHFSDRVHLHISDEGQRFRPEEVLAPHHAAAHVYVCGPEGFMGGITDAARGCGYPPERLHQEFFNREVETGGDSFTVDVPELGVTVAVGENETIVAALQKAGIKVKVSCEQGVCGTCLANVCSGVPDHRDEYLTDEEREANDQILLCCSRAKTPRLVIESFEYVKLK